MKSIMLYLCFLLGFVTAIAAGCWMVKPTVTGYMEKFDHAYWEMRR